MALIYGTMGLLNFAHGDVVTFGGYAALFFATRGLPYPWLAVPAAVLAGACLGLLLDRVAFRPLWRFGPMPLLISSVAVSVVLSNGILAFAGPNVTNIRTSMLTTVIQLPLEISLSQQKLLIATVSLAALGVVYWAIQTTDFGRRVKAVAEDREFAQLSGVNPEAIFPWVMALSTALAALAGSLVAPVLSITPDFGSLMLIKVFAIIVIGGLGSFPGALLGALSFGIIESIATLYLDPSWVSTMTFMLLFAVLLVRPSGLFARSIARA
jgi:branched-chain amino acid transport system permease protein